ncbi:putative membrane protein [Malaciobacter marinus]|uniref:Putative membrane protein n=1 Tax=Malaciobacter marinus TaxID=505249 RepID=A0A347TJ66_9BACT|nr:hypothetical protein [Malaciobacter marinus]AXX86644.1 putative membrane protein [Malaciobacter marinus]PHO14689.1 hypothetical protein CPH92_10455 [Malaciobacter marinus]
MILNITTIYLILIIVPIYFYLNGTVYNTSGFESAKVLPLSYYITFLIGLYVLITKKYKISFIDIFILLSLIIAIATLTFSILILDLKTVNLNLFLLYFIPQVFSYIIGKEISKNYNLDSTIKILSISLCTFISIHFLDTLLNKNIYDAIINRGTDNIFYFMTIYQKLVSYPLVLSIILFLTLFSNIKYKYIYSSLIFFEIVVSAAREPLAMLLFMFLLFFLLNIKNISILKILKVISLLFFSLVLIVLFLDIEDLYIYNKLMLIFDSSMEGYDLSGGRIEQILRFLEYLPNLNIIIGEGFLISEYFPEGTFHNQWIEYFVKGGLFFFLSMLFIFIFAIKKALVLSKYDRKFQLVAIILITLLLVSFNINTPMRTPYSSIIIWLIIGYVSNGINYKKDKIRL